MFDIFGGPLDTVLFFAVAIIVATVTRIFNKSDSKDKQSLRGQIRAAVERATAVPPPMTAGQYAAPTQPPWHAPPAPPVRPPAPHQHARMPLADLNARVVELMSTNREVAAVRLLCDEADLGIIEAQQYARELTAPVDAPVDVPVDVPAEESGHTGSAAFATSIFETGEDEGWASGWVDKPEPDDRSDIDELWRTVSGGNQAGDRT